MSITCNVTALRYAVTLQVCPDLKIDKLLIPCNYTKIKNEQANQHTDTRQRRMKRTNVERENKTEREENANRKKRKPQKTRIKTRKKPSNSTNGINLMKQPQSPIMTFPSQKQGCMFEEWPPHVRVTWLEH